MALAGDTSQRSLVKGLDFVLINTKGRQDITTYLPLWINMCNF